MISRKFLHNFFLTNIYTQVNKLCIGTIACIRSTKNLKKKKKFLRALLYKNSGSLMKTLVPLVQKAIGAT